MSETRELEARTTASAAGETSLKLVVLVPAYNEESTIEAAVGGLREIEGELLDHGYQLHVIVVNDGSTDGTEHAATRAGAHQVVTHNRNQGLGAAVRSGLKAAVACGADIAVKFDADLQHVPIEIIRLIEPITKGQADIVYGNRMLSYTMPFVRKAGNMAFTWLMRRLTRWPIEDSQPGIFAVNRNFLSDFYLLGNYNYTQQVLLDASHRDLRFAHVSVSFRKRESGASFVSLKYPLRVIPQIIMLLISVKPLQIFGGIGMAFLAVMGLIVGVDLLDYVFGSGAKPIQHVNAVLGFAFMGVQSVYFGFVAHLIVELSKRRS